MVKKGVAVFRTKTKMEELSEKVLKMSEVLLKKTPESVIGIEKSDKGWKVLLEVLETKVTPSTLDFVGVYEFHVDDAGNILGYKQLGIKRRNESLELKDKK